MDLNKVMLIGRLTRDPETRTTPQGVSVANFGIATGRVWKDAQGNQQEATEFHNVVAWRKLGELCAQYLRKGKQVYIEGHLQTRSWEQDGKKLYRTEVIADNMIMLGNKNDSGPSSSYAPPAQQNATPTAPTQAQAPAEPLPEEEIRIEDIPF